MNRETLYYVLFEQQKEFHEKKKFVKRELSRKVCSFLKLKLPIIITGVRRAGKSTLLKIIKDELQLAEKQCLYINFNDERLIDFSVEDFQKILSCDNLRLYTNKDVIGVELGGALKNVIAIGAGIIDGLRLGTNTKASYITRGLREMVRIGKILGGKEETFWGLSGIGDLITTCFSPYSRNRSFGQAIVEVGKEKYLRNTKMVIEGIYTTKSLYTLSKKMNIETPITDAIYRIVFLNKKPTDEIKKLMRRSLKEE